MKYFWLLLSIMLTALGVSLIGLKVQTVRHGPYLEQLASFDYCAQGAKLLEGNEILEAAEMANAGGCNSVREQAQAKWSGLTNTVERCAQGVWQGKSQDVAGASCAVASDLFVVGDIRDLTRQGINFATRQKTDYFLAALSGLGIALTLAPEMDLGVNVLKFARRAGTVGEPLAKTVTKLVRTRAWGPLREVMTDAGQMTRRLGVTNTTEALRFVESPGELKAVNAFVTEHPNVLLALKLGGKDAVKLTDETLYHAALSKGPEGLKLATQKGRRALLASHPLFGIAKSLYKGNAQVILLSLINHLAWIVVLIIAGVLIFVGFLGLLPFIVRSGFRKRGYLGASRAVTGALIVAVIAVVGFPLTSAANSIFMVEPPPKLVGHTEPIGSLAFAPDSAMLVSAGADGFVNVWNAVTWDLVRQLEPAGHPWTLAFSPDGRLLVAGNETGTVKVWDTATWTLVTTFMAYDQTLRSLAYSPDGSMLATGGRDMKPSLEGRFRRIPSLLTRDRTTDNVKLWSTSDWLPLRTLEDYTSQIVSLSFDPSGGVLASGTEDGKVTVIDTESWETLHSWQLSESTASSLAFDRAGGQLAVVGSESGLQVWSTVDWQPLPNMSLNLEATTLAYGPQTIALGGDDGTAVLRSERDSASQEQVQTDMGSITALGFSPDGRYLALGGATGAITIQALPVVAPGN